MNLLKTFFRLVILSIYNLTAVGQEMLEKYQRAEQFMAGNISKIVYNENVYPTFIGESSKFWYINESEIGYEYYLVDPVKKTNKRAFNHKYLAEELSYVLNSKIDPNKLDLSNLEFNIAAQEISFSIDELDFKFNLKKKRLSIIQAKLDSNDEIKSPDEKWIAYIQNYNIWIKDVESEETFQLSDDGTKKHAYGLVQSWYFIQKDGLRKKDERDVVVYWSPDSKRIIVPRYDTRNAEKLYLYKTTPEKGFRSEVYSYNRALAGDSLTALVEYSLFNIENKSQINLNTRPNTPFLNYSITWLPSGLKAYLLKYSRGYKSRKLVEIDALTGEVRMLLNDVSETYVDPLNHSYFLLEEVGLVLWTSEKSGWNHIYLHDLESGSLLKQVTSGDFTVKDILYINQQSSKICFTAFGMENGDPYNQHLYTVNFSGEILNRITRENAYHSVFKSPDQNYIVDVFSTVKQPTQMAVYQVSDARKIMTVTQANIEELNSLRWKIPESFKVKARDDSTDVYGLIYKPTDFDSTKKYPIIDATYSGPHTIRTPKTFKRAILNNELAIAELGFIVVTIDGLGTAFRSKKFHDFSYQNLGDIGCEDHVKAIKELANKYPFMDTSRIGIYGHSAGGYDAVRALILRPDFYKVAVSSAGNHDHRIAKAWWPELYMGFPAEKHYDEQSNILNADKIKGKLLLAHGNMDNNVNPTGSLRLSDALIKANKDFEIIITPGDDHDALYYNKYFIRKRWDFFVKHLLNVTPPKEYNISEESVK